MPSPPHNDITPSIVQIWQDIVDILADICNVPAALIMRLDHPDIAVLMANHGEENPYHSGDRHPFENSGLYCETVIKTNAPLQVVDARTDPDWRHNPDMELNMVSYLGYPIAKPDGSPFGTLCVLDNRPHKYNERIQRLMARFRDMIEADLELVAINKELGENNRKMSDVLDELRVLRGFVSICAACKAVKDGDRWLPLDALLLNSREISVSHGLCPDCLRQLYPDFLPKSSQ